ncbi:MAG: hypothetical protein QOF63_3276 [Thermoanaerobaculia bacterium]|jgi:hypothetical protein|nr:hypothetical protein [Thermoanaerobaculia bacterium]
MRAVDAAMKHFLSALALAAIAAAAQAQSVELIAPRPGAVLEGGSETTLQWSATSLSAHAEEWEAFLSFDGGRYYATRITPHLDADRRSFQWRVPNVAASNVRILLRIGDEREERAIEFPQTFRIVPGVVRSEVPEVHATLTEAAGESALPASPPVIEWVSGDREGAGLVISRHRDATTLHGCEIAAGERDDVVAGFTKHSTLKLPRIAIAPTIRTTYSAACAREHAAPRPLLLLLTRLNV